MIDEYVHRGFSGRVLYMARAPFVSGAERSLLSMLRHLDRSRIEPALVLGCETELVDAARALDVPTTMIAMPKRSVGSWLGWRRSLRQLEHVIEGFRPSVMHANDVPSCQAMSVVADQHGVSRVIHVRWGIAARDAGWFARHGAERVLCVSRWVRDRLGDTAGTPLHGATVDVLHDAVDWPAQEVHGDDDRTSDDGGRPTVGFAGQLIEPKGLDMVVEALSHMPAARRPHLLVAGRDVQTGGAYEATLRDLAQRRGVADRVDFLGFLADPADLFRRVTAMVCPSRIEPLGLVPLEAARFAVPTFANRLGGFLETIEHGQSGYLVDPTPRAWAEALERVHDRAQMAVLGQAAHDATRQRFSPAVYQTRLMAAYGEVSA